MADKVLFEIEDGKLKRYYGNEDNVVIPHGVTVISSNAFVNSPKMTSVIIPDSVQEIGYDAFRNSNIASLTIPDSVTIIEENAFRSCEKLSSLTIPGSVTDIELYAFEKCEKLSVTCPRGSYAWKACKGKNIPLIASSGFLSGLFGKK